MSGSVAQINISKGGVPKVAIEKALVTPLGLEGDLHAHPEIHGGPAKALLWITSEGIAELMEAGFPLYPGALGENVTTLGIDRRDLRLGQKWRIGEAVIELTRIRTPCRTIEVYGQGIGAAVYDLNVKAGDSSSPRWGLSGFYAAVLEPGVIRVGDEVSRLDHDV